MGQAKNGKGWAAGWVVVISLNAMLLQDIRI
jgi:hypothetical protein